MAIGIGSSDVAGAIFGSTTGESIFAAKITPAATPAQQAAKVSIDAAEREINRIRGYKLQLTPADKKRLSEIQEKIQIIDKRASVGEARPDELDDRSELYREADKILGKPSADVESDKVLEGLRQKIDDLLAPRLNGAKADRLETLEKLKATFEAQIDEGSGGQLVYSRLTNVSRLIKDLAPPRHLHELSQSERAEYDKLVEEVNQYAGAKLILDARDSDRVYNLQKTIDELKSSLPPDTSGQPTASDVARAYSRIG